MLRYSCIRKGDNVFVARVELALLPPCHAVPSDVSITVAQLDESISGPTFISTANCRRAFDVTGATRALVFQKPWANLREYNGRLLRYVLHRSNETFGRFKALSKLQ